MEENSINWWRTPPVSPFMEGNSINWWKTPPESPFMEENSINWWRTTPESPDCNPIENLWPELKEYIRREIKPRTKVQLVEGIQVFWVTFSSEKCTTYIRHLNKVLPKLIEMKEKLLDTSLHCTIYCVTIYIYT